ncbi:hypothetical protein [Methylobacterium sp. Gmos1]
MLVRDVLACRLIHIAQAQGRGVVQLEFNRHIDRDHAELAHEIGDELQGKISLQFHRHCAAGFCGATCHQRRPRRCAATIRAGIIA